MGSFPEMMCGFIGVDVSCQSNIRGTGNWQWRWWGNPHAYISADKGAVTTGLRLPSPPFPPSPILSLSLSTLHVPPPWNPPSLLTRKAFMFLVFHAVATPASRPLLQPRRLASSSALFAAPRSAGRGGVRRGCRLTPPAAVSPWSNSTGAVEELIALFMGLFTLLFLEFPRRCWGYMGHTLKLHTPLESARWSSNYYFLSGLMFSADLHPLLCKEQSSGSEITWWCSLEFCKLFQMAQISLSHETLYFYFYR